MPWIKSHTGVERNWKVIAMAAELGIKRVYLSGHLHAFWHTVLEQQEDGILDRWPDSFIAECAMYEGDAKMFVALLRKYNFIDDGNLVHDWLDYTGQYLHLKYHNSNQQKLKEIRAKFLGNPKERPKGRPKGQKNQSSRLSRSILSSSLNSSSLNSSSSSSEGDARGGDLARLFWDAYPKRISWGQVQKAWAAIKPKADQQLLDKMLTAIQEQKEWRENAVNGEFRPEWKHPATWIRAKGWMDVTPITQKEQFSKRIQETLNRGLEDEKS